MPDELKELQNYRAELAVPGAAAQRNAREQLARAIEHELVRSRRRRRRLRTAAATPLALAVTAVIVASVLRSGSPAGPPPAAAAVLARLASVAAKQAPAPRPQPRQYRQTTTWSTDENVFGACKLLVGKYRQTWIAGDGSGVMIERDGKPTFLSASSERHCTAMHMTLAGETLQSTRYGRHCLSSAPVDLRGLPTDPARLRAMLLTGKVEGGPRGPGEAFIQTGDLLRQTSATPSLRAALYRAAAGLSGVSDLGNVTDHAGRSGVGLAILDRGLRLELIFDPKTSMLLGERKTVALPNPATSSPDYGAPAGTTIGWAVFYPARIVDSLPPGSSHQPLISCEPPPPPPP